MKNFNPNLILRGVKIEDTKFVDAVETQKMISHPTEKKMDSSINVHSPNFPEHEMKRIEKAAYQKGLQEGQIQGYQMGYEEGVDQGFKKGASVTQDELKDTISMLNIIAMAFLIRKEELFEQIKPEIIKLCLELCHKLVQRELSDPEAFKELLMKVLEQVKSITKDIPIDVMISSEDYEIIQNKFASMTIGQEAMPKIRLIADSFMEKGNCRLETSIGMMNFDIKRILQDLETKILEA